MTSTVIVGDQHNSDDTCTVMKLNLLVRYSLLSYFVDVSVHVLRFKS